MAAFLAEEIGGDLRVALDRPTEAYQAEFGPLGEGRCTPDQARERRRLVCELCWWQLPGDQAPFHDDALPIVADLDMKEVFTR